MNDKNPLFKRELFRIIIDNIITRFWMLNCQQLICNDDVELLSNLSRNILAKMPSPSKIILEKCGDNLWNNEDRGFMVS